MTRQDRYPPDQQFGAEASRDEQRAEGFPASNAQSDVEADIERKASRVGNKAGPAEDR